MPTLKAIRDALDHHGVPRAGSMTEGYHRGDGPSGTVIVRWGSGKPFEPDYGIPGGNNTNPV